MSLPIGVSGEEWLLEVILQRLALGLNYLLVITGQSGSGKSYTALRLASKLNPSFNPETNVVFDLATFLDRLNAGRFAPGSVVVWDESGIDIGARSAMSKINRAFSAFIESGRFLRLCLIFTVPSLSQIDANARRMAHLVLETEVILRDRAVVRCKPFFVRTTREGAELFVYPRFDHTPKGPIRLTSILVGKPHNALAETYEAMRESHMRGVYRELADSLKAAEPKNPAPFKASVIDAALLAHPEKSDREIASELGANRSYVWERRRILDATRA